MDIAGLLLEALPGRVVTNVEELGQYRLDRSGHVAAGTPIAAVHARSIEDVQAACRIAYETDTPIVTRGAGTGLAGGGIADSGEIVLCMGSMQDILEISPANRLAVVQPGILNGALNEVLVTSGCKGGFVLDLPLSQTVIAEYMQGILSPASNQTK